MLRTPPPRSFAYLPAAILLLAMLNLNIPFYSVGPGPARDVKPLITVTGATTYASDGELLLTTVQLQPSTIGTAIMAIADPLVYVVPRRSFTRGLDDEEISRVTAIQMEDSKRLAAAAALAYLGHPVRLTGSGARVVALMEDMPAAQVLEVGDVIVAVDGTRVSDQDQLVEQVVERDVGASMTLRVVRAGRQRDVEISSVQAPRRHASRTADGWMGPALYEPSRPVIGVHVATEDERIELPFGIDIRSDQIGGPSAGLMFALGVIDVLEGPDGLTAGGIVAGTGVITLDGEVRGVGGVRQKVSAAEKAGASVFIVPQAEAQEAMASATRIRVVPVRTLEEAVQALRQLQRPVAAVGSD